MIGDGTVFLPFDKDHMYDTLGAHKFEKYGNEVLYNGRTGEQIQTDIFIGPTFYLRLKHMVTDKVHARGTGPRVQLTRQPTSGRSKQGGLRIGEMEKDTILAHGMSHFTKECMMEKGDKYTWAVCRHCGTLAKYAPSRGIFECLDCKSQDLSIVETPYSFKLLIQEMEAMGVQIRLSSESLEPFEEEFENTDKVEFVGGDCYDDREAIRHSSLADVRIAIEEEEKQQKEEETPPEPSPQPTPLDTSLVESLTNSQGQSDSDEEDEEDVDELEPVPEPSVVVHPTDEDVETPANGAELVATGGGENETKVIHIDTSKLSRISRTSSGDIEDEGFDDAIEDDEFFTAP